jgi:hypothetical protein
MLCSAILEPSSKGWNLIWGLNLGKGTAQAAIQEAKEVLAATEPYLFAFEIGNEPDLFPRSEAHRKKGYDYDDYLREYRKFRDALRKELPGMPLAGPDVADATSWVTRFARDEGKDIKLLTHHYYREGQNPTSNIDKLLYADPKLDPMLAQLRAATKSSGIPYRTCETNSFSGGGKPGVSDTLASALWVLDFMFALASTGCAGVNMETGVNQRGFISSYSPIGDTGTTRQLRNSMACWRLLKPAKATSSPAISRLAIVISRRIPHNKARIASLSLSSTRRVRPRLSSVSSVQPPSAKDRYSVYQALRSTAGPESYLAAWPSHPRVYGIRDLQRRSLRPEESCWSAFLPPAQPS